MANICIIAPRLPPSIDGIGDYSRRLWQGLTAHPRMSEANFSFVLLEGAPESSAIMPSNVLQCQRSAASLLDNLQRCDATIVLLQYVGYGYSANGAPTWLADGLNQWKLARPERSLVIMFHETWSQGKPWQKVFWQTASQKESVARLLRCADVVATSMEANRLSLLDAQPKAGIRIIPIGSNFTVDAPRERNWRHLTVFGKEAPRQMAVRDNTELLKYLDRRGLVEQIILSGEQHAGAVDQTEQLIRSMRLKSPTNCFYNFASSAVPQAVQTCGLALMHAHSRVLLKSTSFQLAVQLGQVSLVRDTGEPGEPLVDGRHFIGYKPNQLGTIAQALEQQDVLNGISASSRSLACTYLSWEDIADKWAALLANLITNKTLP